MLPAKPLNYDVTLVLAYAVFTRVSSSLQWIRSAVDALSRHPEQFTLLLNITKLGIVGNANRNSLSLSLSRALALALSLSLYLSPPPHIHTSRSTLPSWFFLVTHFMHEQMELGSQCIIQMLLLLVHEALSY